MDKPKAERMLQLWVVTLIILTSLCAGSTNAMMVKIPLEQLVREAELIVVGQVESVKGQKREGIIFSTAKLRAKRVLKGQVPPQGWISVEFEGGRMGDETFTTEDSPDYKTGEEAIAFLKKLPGSDKYTTVGLLQGKYLIEKGKVLPEYIPLDTFLQQIEALLSKGKPSWGVPPLPERSPGKSSVVRSSKVANIYASVVRLSSTFNAASITFGQNWIPAFFFSSSTTSSIDLALR